MEKKLEDYLPFYLGCEVQLTKVDEQLTVCMDSQLFGKKVGDVTLMGLNLLMCYRDKIIDFKLLLRPLSDMTDSELTEFNRLRISFEIGLSPEGFRYLLSKHFDLFGLIEAGLAIDKTKTINDGISDNKNR